MPSHPEYMSGLRWRVLRLLSPGQPLRFVYYPPTRSADLRVIRPYNGDGHDMARLVWQVCDDCERASLNKISIDPNWQRRGLGRRLINRALRDGPDYAWVTSGQSPAAKRFFPVISNETGVVFEERGRSCQHMNAARNTYVARPAPQPVLDRTI